MSRVRMFPSLWVLLALTIVPARADDLPPLPLPDCVANGLAPDDETDCEGMATSYFGPTVPRPTQGSVTLTIDTRAVDFRTDADRGGTQVLTLTYAVPTLAPAVDGSGTTTTSAVKLFWPERIGVPGGGESTLYCRFPTTDVWTSSCDAALVNPPNGFALLDRVGACAATATSCQYRITWGAYGTRVRQPMMFRLALQWHVNYTRQFANQTFDPACGSDPVEGCNAGGGINLVTFGTLPPAPLNATAAVRRLGARAFEFDGTASSPDVVAYSWFHQLPQFSSTAAVFERTFAFDEVPLAGASAIELVVTDRWGRTDSDAVPFSFLAPEGTEGPLDIVSYDLVGLDDEGNVTLSVVVRNTTEESIDGVFLLSTEFTGELAVEATPGNTSIAPGATATFTVTTTFDERSRITISVQAFGTSAAGTVTSGAESKRVNRTDVPPPAGTRTTITQATAPGADRIEVASNDGFQPGDYVVLDPEGANAETRRVDALGSLIFAAPLAKPHAVGEAIVLVAAPGGDVAGPVIDVSAPAPGTLVCPSAPLTLVVACSDAGVGVETCGGDVGSGDVLDTQTAGAHQVVVRAWDGNGNASEQVVAWTVQGGVDFATVRCALDAIDAALATAGPPDVDAKSKAKLGKLARTLRAKVEQSAAAVDAKKRRKALKGTIKVAKKLQKQIAKGVKTKKVSDAFGTRLQDALGGGQSTLDGLLASG